MQDFFNNELKTGDVIYIMNQKSSGWYNGYIRATIERFTEKMVCCIYFDENNQLHKVFRRPNRIILDKSYELNKKYMYAIADIENINKRYKKIISDNETYKNEKLIKELLDIIDDFERGFASFNSCLEQISDEADEIITGFSLVYKNLCKKLQAAGLKEIKINEGDTFDSDTMNCMGIVNIPNNIDNTVVSVSKKGYIYKDKIIRYANVIVNKTNNE